MALLVVSDYNVVSVPTERHTWMKHPTFKDSLWKRTIDDTVEAGSPLGFEDSKSTGSGTPLSHDVYKTLFRDNDDGEGSIISRSILRMLVDKEEVPWVAFISSPRLSSISFLISGLEGSWPNLVSLNSTNWGFEKP